MENETFDFISELLLEAEAKEKQLEEAQIDLLLAEVGNLESKISRNFDQVKAEKAMLDEWVLKTNTKLQDRLEWIIVKVEAWLRERGDKTVELPHGTIQFRKQPDRVEINDIDTFLKSCPSELISINEQIKPNLRALADYVKSHSVPNGAAVIKGEQQFKYKIKTSEKE